MLLCVPCLDDTTALIDAQTFGKAYCMRYRLSKRTIHRTPMPDRSAVPAKPRSMNIWTNTSSEPEIADVVCTVHATFKLVL